MTWSQQGEESLLARCNAGDEAAWQQVHGYVLNVARHACGRGGSPEDLSAGVMLRLIKGGMRKDQSAVALRSYLRRAVLCAAIDAHRSPRAREVSLDEPRRDSEDDLAPPVEIRDPAPSLDEGVLSGDIRRIIGEILGDLSADCVKLLKAYFSYKIGWIEDYKELSRTLGRPIGSISVQVRRCLTRFRQDPRSAVLQRDAG